MQRFTAAARALAYAVAAAGSIFAASGAHAAGDTTPIAPTATSVVLASLNSPFTEPDEAVNSPDRATSKSSTLPARVRTTITGDASFYDENGETASGERYDPKAFTAAAQLLLRGQFGGIRFGKNYQPSYGVAEWGGKKAIIKFNDVGPLAPGRAFDFSRATMKYFGGVELGVLPHVTVTILPPGRNYAQGPVTDTELAAIEASFVEVASAKTEARFAIASTAQETRCGATSLSLQPISLDAIRNKFVRTAALDDLDGMAFTDIAGSGDGLPSDLGTVTPSQILP